MKEIKLWKNRNELSDKVALVDDEDCGRVMEAIGKRAKWYAHSPPGTKEFYALGGKRARSIHRVVMRPPSGMDVDHINGDPLDNRKENLRICTRSQNTMNKKLRSDSTTGYKGVYRLKPVAQRRKYVSKKTGKTTYYTSVNEYKNKPYKAMIGIPGTSGKKKSIGYYATADEAALAYNEWAVKLYGEFAYLNKLKEK